MALKATVFKAQVQISDMDRHDYESHVLTLARHPSETDVRMMVRLLAFCLYADPQRAFTTPEQPGRALDGSPVHHRWRGVWIGNGRETAALTPSIRKSCAD